MLKRELIQHMRRLWRVLLAVILAYLMISAYTMQSVAVNISMLHNITAWIQLLPYSYGLFYGVTVSFLVLISLFYILRTIFDYRQGRTRWMLLSYTEKPRICADALLFAIIIILFYLLSLIILYLGFQYHLQLLENHHLFLAEEYRSFAMLLSTQNAYSLLYPSSFLSFIIMLCLFLSVIIGGTSVIYTFKSEFSHKIGLIYLTYIILIYLSYTTWKSEILMILIPLMYCILFMLDIKKSCGLKQQGG